MKESEQQDHASSSESSSPSARALWKILAAIIIVILLAICAYLAWQLKLCRDEHAADVTKNDALQAQVDDLKKQLSAQGQSSSSQSSSSACSTQAVITQDLKDNLAAAISSKNTAALKGYMASSVNVVFAASEKQGAETPDQAITDLDYLNSNATAPWNFNLSAATLNSFKAGSYKQYFDGVVYVGESANQYVISYRFDTCGKISVIFVSASADLLTP